MRLALLAAALVASAPLPAFAEGRATTKDAQLLVQKAVEVLKSKGREKAFADFSDPKGPFSYRDLYVFVHDLNGKTLAHGANPAQVGKSVLEMKDADGKPYVKERIELARKKGSGWIDYKYKNPATGQVEQKVTYFVLVEDVIVACGAYKP